MARNFVADSVQSRGGNLINLNDITENSWNIKKQSLLSAVVICVVIFLFTSSLKILGKWSVLCTTPVSKWHFLPVSCFTRIGSDKKMKYYYHISSGTGQSSLPKLDRVQKHVRGLAVDELFFTLQHLSRVFRYSIVIYTAKVRRDTFLSSSSQDRYSFFLWFINSFVVF